MMPKRKTASTVVGIRRATVVFIFIDLKNAQIDLHILLRFFHLG